MESEDLEFCNSVLQELFKRPCSKPFLNPVPIDDDEFSGYYVKIKKPMCFSKIQEKMLTNVYKNVHEWEKDVNLIFSNTEKFFGKKHYYSYMAQELRARFDKIMNSGAAEKPREWGADIEELLERVGSIIDSAPENISSHWRHEITIKPLPKMKTSNVRNLIRASQQLTGKEDARSMFSIIKQLNPSVDAFTEDVTLDLDTLSNKTHYALEWYLQKRFEEEGLEYPTSKR